MLPERAVRLWPPNWKKDKVAPQPSALLKSLLQKEEVRGDEAWAGTGGASWGLTGAGGAIKGKALAALGPHWR